MGEIRRRIAIGDVQGCFDSLRALLGEFGFDSSHDRIWLVGDLVNRGPKSLAVLRWVRQHQACVQMVLGNHDLHLLSCFAGVRVAKATDTFNDVLAAPDAADLLDWLRCQPLCIADDQHCLVHAGAHPSWDFALLQDLATRISAQLSGPHWRAWLRRYNEYLGPLRWDPADSADQEVSQIKALKIMTLMRCCAEDGALDMQYTGPADACPAGVMPWFRVPRRQAFGRRVVFGHWAALGFYNSDMALGLDSGCVWGRRLTAYDLISGSTWSVPCRDTVHHQHPSWGR